MMSYRPKHSNTFELQQHSFIRSKRAPVACLMIAGICGLIVVAAGGCGVDDGRADSATASATTSFTASATSAIVAPTTVVQPKTTARQEVPTSPPAVQPAPAAQALMPNVVCMNLQAAQDAIQGAGVWYSRSTDATGQGRRQVLDANWLVVAQTPAPGVLIGEGEALLSVVKIGERNSCR
ncbi:PASTA domain-containing protein [Nocardia suismassiliense]|uniref:PASTA domain-containing protein n=1 Tax=Nocardia suismassiliense TaxID=2077092 RepID=A0ABW6QL06_9NOCA